MDFIISIIFKKIVDNSTIANGAHNRYKFGVANTVLVIVIHDRWCINIAVSFSFDANVS